MKKPALGKGAQKEYEKAVELVPADERGYVALAVCHIKQKHFELARPLLAQALELNPSFSETLYWLSVLTTPIDPANGLRLLERAVKNGFRDRKRIIGNKAFEKLEDVPPFKNLLSVFGKKD